MSDPLKIALVAEGPTDFEVIQAALKAVLPHPFIITLLQPEATQPQMGGGWGGVLKWCHAAQQRYNGSLDTDPTLSGFDLLIIHVDVDVSTFQYDNCGAGVTELAQQNNWGTLPCSETCPPVADTVAALMSVIQSWLGQATPGDRTLFCLPAQSSGTWLAAAVLAPGHTLLAKGECDVNLENRLANLPKGKRIKKNKRDYQAHAPHITQHWTKVKGLCTLAANFEQTVLTVVRSL
ncbi:MULTISPECIES: hypothetical protein [Arthrospira]|jgi:hypothetical protein|uniref:Uncharacterized protein n=1 Tax=Limnospira platensis NIES-46 TaxID=1236695 RepID=A0A5M3T2C0_LIMPL|nr:hypothetical protein [Arthrospira platensis]AMW26964.1 hypothetical protein AP285_02095 [Arthrospira platensis YZ]KDR54629.1 hypothetical protein APPUASWS_027470 [Arthrospira platensis str. Paraca]MBD2670773.1 hypothetical protein [Arthrospira platensis FACHB-439]MBD2711332.1 hypothetical protein [Arthrospira platensis FACHB-835]MDF2211633.1 hypothetical protein [Arthrospira platensis NCB002]MDT9183995.1 hypothetical protein [Limnospira sp. PMC 289.06]MDT9296217.1 hypothetical protein [Ar